MRKYVAEFIGTFTLVLFGCGAAIIAGKIGKPEGVGILGIAFAFGFSLIAMAYGIGPISGCHINPAVSLGVFVARRMNVKDLVGYILAQFLGGVAGAAMLAAIMGGLGAGYNIVANGLGQNGWGPGYLGEYRVDSAIIFELVATLIFLIVILGSTGKGAPTQMAGLAIGITLIAIHLFGINVTGVSLNPARSLGPALLVGGKALQQVWLFLVVPSVAGILGGILFRAKVLEQ